MLFFCISITCIYYATPPLRHLLALIVLNKTKPKHAYRLLALIVLNPSYVGHNRPHLVLTIVATSQLNRTYRLLALIVLNPTCFSAYARCTPLRRNATKPKQPKQYAAHRLLALIVLNQLLPIATYRLLRLIVLNPY